MTTTTTTTTSTAAIVFKRCSVSGNSRKTTATPRQQSVNANSGSFSTTMLRNSNSLGQLVERGKRETAIVPVVSTQATDVQLIVRRTVSASGIEDVECRQASRSSVAETATAPAPSARLNYRRGDDDNDDDNDDRLCDTNASSGGRISATKATTTTTTTTTPSGTTSATFESSASSSVVHRIGMAADNRQPCSRNNAKSLSNSSSSSSGGGGGGTGNSSSTGCAATTNIGAPAMQAPGHDDAIPISTSGFSLKSRCTNPFLVGLCDDDDADADDDDGKRLDPQNDDDEIESFRLRDEFTEMQSTENDCAVGGTSEGTSTENHRTHSHQTPQASGGSISTRSSNTSSRSTSTSSGGKAESQQQRRQQRQMANGSFVASALSADQQQRQQHQRDHHKRQHDNDKSLLLLNEMEEPISLPMFVAVETLRQDDCDDDDDAGDNTAAGTFQANAASGCERHFDVSTGNHDYITAAAGCDSFSPASGVTNALQQQHHKSCASLYSTVNKTHHHPQHAQHHHPQLTPAATTSATPPNSTGFSSLTPALAPQQQQHRTSTSKLNHKLLLQRPAAKRVQSTENVCNVQTAHARNDFNRAQARKNLKFTGTTTAQANCGAVTPEPNMLNGVPTLPFQRQDYVRPLEDSDADMDAETTATTTALRVRSKLLRKDLFSFGATSNNKDKALMPHIKKLNIAFPSADHKDANQEQSRHLNFKKSLLRLGHKLRISRSPEKSRIESETNALSPALPDHHRLQAPPQDVNFVSKSDIDISMYSHRQHRQLSSNLEAFLEQNYDRITATRGSQSIGKASTSTTTARKKRHGHKRTKSCTRSGGVQQMFGVGHPMEYANVNVDDSSDSGDADGSFAPRSDHYLLENDCGSEFFNDYRTYNGSSSTRHASLSHEPQNHSHHPHLEHQLQPQQLNNYHLQHQHQHQNLSLQQNHQSYSHIQTPSSSDSFSTYRSNRSKLRTNLSTRKSAHQSDYTAPNNIEVEAPASALMAVEPLLLTSHTTSSSLSSNDYATVYSPSKTSTSMLNEHAHYMESHALHHPPKSLEISPKHRRMKGTATRPTNPQPRQHYRIDDDCHAVRTTAAPASSSSNVGIDKSHYQFENQLPYHEDYLTHYHNHMVKAAGGSTPLGAASSIPVAAAAAAGPGMIGAAVDYPTSSSSNGSYYMAHRRPSFSASIVVGQSTTAALSSSSSHSNQSYATADAVAASAQHRIIVSQSKKLHGEVVLEYEC